MKLLGCRISNFGAFHNYELTFNDGMNVILQANGWGKSTLAAFIKAMLYGFEGKRVRNVSENERLRYTPWQGGTYGGSLDFEAQGREYRVIRTFGRTAARDTVRVLDIATGSSALDEVGSNVGEWLFGLDANAFQKSVYVAQNGMGFGGSATGLRNRLNALMNEADDVAGFDKAQAKLDERRKYYRRTGNRGKIAEANAQIAKLVGAVHASDEKIAELEALEHELEELGNSVGELEGELSEAQTAADREQSALHEAAALARVGQQLRGRQDEASQAYASALQAFAGKVPTEDDLREARRLLSELNHAQGERDREVAQAKAAHASLAALESEHEGRLPSAEELSAKRAQLAEYQTQASAFDDVPDDSQSSFEVMRAAIAADPSLLRRCDSAVASLGSMRGQEAACKDAEARLESERSAWKERKQQILQLAAGCDEAESSLSATAHDEAEALRRDASKLRELETEEAKADMALRAARTRQEEASKAVEGFGAMPSEAQLGEIEELAATASQKAELLAQARTALDGAEERAAQARRASQSAQEELDAHTAKLAEERAKPPVAAIACLVLGLAAFALGTVAGPALFALGAALAVAGVILFLKKGSAPAEPDAAKVAAAREAREAYEAASASAKQAAAELDAVLACSKNASAALADAMGETMPGETADPAAAAALVPLLRQRILACDEAKAKAAGSVSEAEASEAELQALRAQEQELLERHGMSDCSASNAASTLERRALEIEAQEKEADNLRERLYELVGNEIGGGVAPDEGLAKRFVDGIDSFVPSGVQTLEADLERLHEGLDHYADELYGLLDSLGYPCEEGTGYAVAADRLGRALASFKADEARRSEMHGQKERRRKELQGIADALATWADAYGARGIDELTNAWFASMEASIAAAERLRWQQADARRKADLAREAAASLEGELAERLAAFGVTDASDPAQGIEELAHRSEGLKALLRAKESADTELRIWLEKNGAALSNAAAITRGQGSGQDAQAKVNQLQERRDELLGMLAQRGEQRSALLASMEGALAVRQELELLSKKKQTAVSNLFTVQKTAEYLTQAREGLDGRYLGDLSDRFCDYANAWLGSDELEATVNAEFSVEILDGDDHRDVAGYSTGYRDLLDMCLRMALVDTLFQAEKPFIVMDDPFMSLDADKMGSAFALLGALAQSYQIIYFTCHPSRTEEGGLEHGAVSFMLPEQRERRELPRARAEREARERAQAQAELVASYVVEPVSAGKAGIAPASKRHSVSNNLFNIEFCLDDARGSADNSFEVHFIDEKGRALCERQNVDVVNGHVVPDRVRFSLSTKDDSGDVYDLIIHEDGREASVLAARIAYTSDVSFASDDFGF